MSRTTLALSVGVVLFTPVLFMIEGIRALVWVLQRDVAVPRLALVVAGMLAGAVLLIPTLGSRGYRQASGRLIDGLVGQPALALLSPMALELYLRIIITAAGVELVWRSLQLIV